MKLTTLDQVLEQELKDIFSAENQLLKALPKMAKKATSETLQMAFTTHAEETKVQIERLEKIADILGIKLSGKTCKAMQGLLEEGKETLEEKGEGSLIDVLLIGSAQRVEHYEISAYGTTRAIAEALGHEEVVELLQETLDEESACDDKLSEICEGEILPLMAEGDDSYDDDEPRKGASK